MNSLPDETLLEAVAALEAAGGNKAEAARALGIPRETLRARIAAATRRGLSEYTPALPEGLFIERVTTHYNKDGLVSNQWVKSKAEADMEGVVEAITAAFESYKGLAEPAQGQPDTDADLLATYLIADPHIGLYAWRKEVGADYDLNIGRDLLRGAADALVAATPPASTGLILGLGDFFHSDTNENRTRRGGNPLDVDGRQAKILQVGVETSIYIIDQAKQKHDKVHVRFLPGNHDPYSAIALTVALAAFYSSDPRVIVDTSPDPFFFFRFGKVLIGATHGDMAKPETIPGVMAAERPKDWGETEYRYGYAGHFHSKRLGGDVNGATWEVFQTLAPKDIFGHSMGYASGRSMTAIVHHKDRGEITRHLVNVPRLGRGVSK